MIMHRLSSLNLWNQAPDVHDGINTYQCQTMVIEDAGDGETVTMANGK